MSGMKTYGRKKIGEATDIIFDINELCRLCMNKEEDLLPIFVEEETIPLTIRIMACVSLEVFEGDGLPSKICRACTYQLEKSYNFRKKCESVDLKLRSHLSSVRSVVNVEDVQKSSPDSTINRNTTVSPSGKRSKDSLQIEEDLVGVTKMAFIQPDADTEDNPENITLSTEEHLDKEACTLKSTSSLKKIHDNTDSTELNDVSLENMNQELDNSGYGAIADAVKATLSTQPGFNIDGDLQMKITPSQEKSITEVEVTTEDGSIIVMELMTDDSSERNSVVTPKAEVNEDGEVKIFKCPNCTKSFARRIQLRRHSSVHMKDRGFSCGMCEKWFPTRSALTRHERIHTGERPFQCEICQKSFAQKEILYRHLLTHSGQKPFKCIHCNRNFAIRESLRVHMRLHTKEHARDINLHYCSICPKVFCHASGLSRHLLTHTGKVYKCRQCDKNFTDQSSLARHCRQMSHPM